MLGEYGGFGVQVKGHTWAGTGEYTCGNGGLLTSHPRGAASHPRGVFSNSSHPRGAFADPSHPRGVVSDPGLTEAFEGYAAAAGQLLSKGLAAQMGSNPKPNPTPNPNP